MLTRFIFLLLLTPASYGSVSIVNNDGAGEGFNDSTVVAAVGGNPGTTLGQQRLNVFNKAAEILNTVFQINQPVKVNAQFNPLTCTPTSAVLGQAGPANYQFQNNAGNYTVYPDALYNQLQNSDVDSSKLEINATFNSNLDSGACLGGRTWYYGYSDNGGSNSALLPVALHEIMHGMGFLSLLNSSGASGATVGGNQVFDIYTKMLKRQSNGIFLKDMSQGDRASAIVSNGDLVWSGAKVNAKSGSYSAGINGGSVRMFAPSSYEGGSSVGHFDSLLSPNEIMEPSYTEFLDSPGLATQLLEDIGWTVNSANTAPTINAISNQTLNEDTDKNITLSGSDPENDSLIYSIVSATASLNASISGTTLTLDPTANFNGSGSVTVQVSDGNLTDSTSFNVTVTAVNDAPIISAISNKTLSEDGSLNISLSSNDVDGPSTTYSLVSSSSNLGASVSGSTLSLNPIDNFSGSGSVTVKVSDGSLEDSTSFNVTVTPVNDRPVITAIPDKTLNEDSQLTFSVSATDVDSSNLVFSLGTAPSQLGASLSGNQLTLDPIDNYFGQGNVEVQVSDGALVASTTFSVTVNAVNDTPVFAQIADVAIAKAGSTVVSLNASDADNDPLSFSIVSAINELNASITNDQLTLDPTDSYEGSSTVTLRVSDGSLTADRSFGVVVSEQNLAPVLANIAPVTLAEDSSKEVTLTATDANSDAITFSISNATAQLGITIENNKLSINPDANFNGNGVVTVTASDGQLNDSQQVQITVTAVDDAPVFTPINTVTLIGTTAQSVSLSATDIDSAADQLTFSIVSFDNALINASLQNKQLTLSAKSAANNNTQILLRVSDGTSQVDLNLAVQLKIAASPQPPVLTTIPPQSVLKGTRKQVLLSATDLDTSSDQLSFSIRSKSGGLSASVTANQLTIDAGNGITEGDYTAEIEVSDGSLTDRQIVNIKIFPDFNLQNGDTKISDGGTLTAGLNAINLGISGGDNQLTVSVFYNGSDQSSLLSRTDQGYQLLMPENGAFAGTYRFDVTDKSGNSARYFIERPLRVVTNVSSLLDAANSQQVYVEGAPAGSEIELSVNNPAITFAAENNRITASDNAQQFNRAASALTLSRSPENKDYRISAESTNLPKGTKDGTIVISQSVEFTVKDADGNIIEGALIKATDQRLEEWQLPSTTTTNTNGKASLTLASGTQTLTVTASGYAEKNIQLESGKSALEITLNKPESPFTLTGSVISQGVDFISEAPKVTLFFSNGTQEVLTTQVNSSGNRATFEWQGDLSKQTPERVNISHSRANDINSTVISSTPSAFVSALLIAIPLPQQQDPIILGGAASGSGAESLMWLLLFVSSFAFYRRKPFTHR